jgi:hypothetical protein
MLGIRALVCVALLWLSAFAAGTAASQPELQLSLALDKKTYTANSAPRVVPTLTARLTLRNTTDKPVVLEFGSGQRYNLEIQDEHGKVVYRWSDDRAFTMMFGQESLGPGEKSYTVEVRLADGEGRALAPGKYNAEGSITATGSRVPRASASFEISGAP